MEETPALPLRAWWKVDGSVQARVEVNTLLHCLSVVLQLQSMNAWWMLICNFKVMAVNHSDSMFEGVRKIK